MALIDNLLSYWKLDGNSNDAHSTINGTDTDITYSAGNGIINDGAGFNGSTSVINFGDNRDTGTGAFSALIWFKTTNTGAFKFILGKSSSAADPSWHIRVTSGDKLNAEFRDSGGVDDLTTTTTVTDGAWHMAVLTRPASGGSVKLYLDNESPLSTANNSRNTSSTYNMTMGADEDGLFDHNGSIDEGGLWDKELSAAEVSELNNSNNGNPYPFSAATTRLIKLAGTFVAKPILTKVGGTFVDKPIKIKVGGVFQDA